MFFLLKTTFDCFLLYELLYLTYDYLQITIYYC